MEKRTTVDLASKLERIATPVHGDHEVLIEAAQRLLELRRLLECSLPSVEECGDHRTSKVICNELGLRSAKSNG